MRKITGTAELAIGATVGLSAGLPGPGSDVAIYSGGNDTVTLDTSPTINSLTLGGGTTATARAALIALSSLTVASRRPSPSLMR